MTDQNFLSAQISLLLRAPSLCPSIRNHCTRLDRQVPSLGCLAVPSLGCGTAMAVRTQKLTDVVTQDYRMALCACLVFKQSLCRMVGLCHPVVQRPGTFTMRPPYWHDEHDGQREQSLQPLSSCTACPAVVHLEMQRTMSNSLESSMHLACATGPHTSNLACRTA